MKGDPERRMMISNDGDDETDGAVVAARALARGVRELIALHVKSRGEALVAYEVR